MLLVVCAVVLGKGRLFIEEFIDVLMALVRLPRKLPSACTIGVDVAVVVVVVVVVFGFF